MVSTTSLRLFATLQDGNGGLAQIYCDGHQHFVFERFHDGVVQERVFSETPLDFHEYIKRLGESGWCFAWANG